MTEGQSAKGSVRERAEALFFAALESLMSTEGEHVLSGISEQNVCGRLAMCLDRLRTDFGFADYVVDTEYNRKQNRLVKTILDHRQRKLKIRPDVIIHTRGRVVNGDNLIAVEMKKSSRSASAIQTDRNRLRAMTKSSYDGVWEVHGGVHPEHVCGYEMGFLVILDISRESVRIERFADGERIGKTEWNPPRFKTRRA
jgi:hypothetical protein